MEQIATNIDILKKIFNYLELSEQLNATQACPEFQYIMVNCIWRYKYRHIKVYKLNGDTFIININSKYKTDYRNCELINEHFVDLRPKQFERFLQLNRENILELELCDYSGNKLEENAQFVQNNKWKFSNLKTLILQYVMIDVKELELIYRNCKKLEILRLKQCCNLQSDLITLNDQDNCAYDILLSIVKTLAEFQIEYREMQFSKSTINLHDLLAKNNLKRLNLNMPLKNLRYKETPRLRENVCEVLEIGNFDEYKTLQKFTRLYLKKFQILSHLTLEGSLNKIFIDSQFIQNLSECTLHLKYLFLKRCLINVDDFGLLSTLTEITLDNCMSLTWRNLRQLLDLPQLQAFHSNYSTYTREFENICIPCNLKRLTLVGNEFKFAQIFDKPKDQLTQLKQLIYYDGSLTKISNISRKFPSLEILHILPHHLELQDIFHLKRLKIFKVPKCAKNSKNILHLMHLIEHPTLSELSLLGGAINLDNELSIDLSNIRVTNLSYLVIDFDVFNYLLEFLLDLLKCNKKLKLIISSDDIADYQYFYNLVTNRKFCKDFIKLCGFQIDRNDITARPKIVERKLQFIRELSEFQNVYIII
ncbi:uncharacterized protein LOC111675811 [Lucilia cuprina]|uniref:uncharacterized protein LOC111675811 n=1 Tax=Lucilia cuprina TaxID=7375 RepID=UPI001F065782|nr:uncharacterized protein LOC111675811 [Lucilia cuprina]